ncbi:Beta-1,4-mannosyl-glycoprotein 4-beta-N-acetylglucosaminyltransferase [Beauveria bassiana]|uniref:Glycosyltransferase family 17 n=1 Tax=Beauveria bassiana (strain ARSEF 2860) TaxID=655819 RepID=J4W1V4_BEAB2|nr:glycosyltransferase family 17 [Beauveria bassiana ARSEF 2860]EJP64460.1 glycosyltransferase family 17 [Beauveria bassiana ARSEF 2860]KAF1735045.1 Beta-1,4-mannosyl-glycoprotein 4-beta-N-acetylglucosaminyltransferase [Beauveria bassiana]KAH8710567.1 Beta-1,4-mannosyl-glycoprotein 4-beta-N-acetylglucosaminyltransferase [Beauveria bassiana]
MATRSTRSRGRLILGLILLGFIWLSVRRTDPSSGGLHEIRNTVSLPPLDFLQASFPARSELHAKYYASREAHEFCAAHGYSAFKPLSSTNERKVYDLVMVNSELDFLEIRLDTLYNYVDYFIIVESPKTFQGDKKSLIIKNNWARFRRFHDKMIYHELTFPPSFNPHRAWDYEDLQRDAMYTQVMPGLTGHKAPVNGDVMVVADVDEIPRPESLLVLRSCNYPRRLTLGSKFYYYSFQFLHDGPEWPHPQATYYQGWRTLKPTNLRNGDGGFRPTRGREKGTLANAAWHCSSCFPTIAQFLNKVASFSHVWMNDKEYRDRNRIADAVREGKDVWEREHDTFTRINGNKDMPPLVKQHPDRFGYMISRDGPSAGFTDYP